MTLGLLELSIGLLFLTLLIYYYLTSNFDFWISRGVKGPKPIPILGTSGDLMLGRCCLADYTYKVYNLFPDESLIGTFAGRKPVLVVRDPELIKDVLIKDFSMFSSRGVRIAAKAEPLSQHLFALGPELWKPLRQQLSPTFTSGKLKEMFYLLKECAEHLENFMEQYVAKNPVIECRDLSAKFTTDVIGVCAFGLKMNAIAEEDSEFRRCARKFLSTSTMSFIRNQLILNVPWLVDLLSPIFYNREMNDFFIGTIAQTMDYRKRNNIKRNDFIDLLMDIRDDPSRVKDIEMTGSLIAAQAFVFFIAGFETSSATISHTLYELALNSSVQDKLQREIKETLDDCKGDLTYESVKKMKYLHKVFCEVLRKYPPAARLMRSSLGSYTFSGTNVTIPKGTTVWIPVYAIQRDPRIYPEPEKFDPERFNEKNVKQRHPSFYLPFGDGPRNCIGARFANYQTKVGLIQILKNYKVEVCDQTPIPYVNNPKTVLLTPLGGLKLRFKSIK